MKKLLCFMWLPMVALLFLTEPVMAMGNAVFSGYSHAVNRALSDPMLAVIAEPVMSHPEHQTIIGAKDNVLGAMVYAALPDGDGYADLGNDKVMKSTVAGYKDRPGWAMLSAH